jgi:tRNA-Thr(GGU) m(6)t(6)A37 methyltransferase TsaA
MRPIGVVETEATRDEVKDKDHVSRIVLRSGLEGALEGLDEFSHLFVLFWMHEVPGEDKPLRVHPRGRLDKALVGVFATRSPQRPNSIGLSLVELLSIEGRVLTVQGLDAFDGTPVLDIKPFDSWDMEETARVPDWWARLEEERSGRGSSGS